MPGIAAAETDKKQLARELFELGIQEYKAKNWTAAANSMQKAYELDPQPDTLYALAQAERLGGNCKAAKEHYEKLLEQAKNDEKTAEAVKGNLELCSQIESGADPKPEQLDAKDAAKRDAPTIQIRTVYRTERHSDTLAIAMFAVGGVALGGAATTYLLARSTRADADHATSLADYNNLFDRARTEREVAYAAAGVGVVLVGWAAVRVITGSGSKTRVKEVAVLPITGGSMIAWSGSW